MILQFDGRHPVIPATAFIAPDVAVIGDVTLGEEASLWFGSVVRGDMNHIRIGRRTNIQDNCTVHVTTDLHPTLIGDEVTIGHNAIIHGCSIGDRSLIGMGAIIMDGAEVGTGSIVAAGAVVTPGTRITPGSLFGGVPAKFLRPVTDDETADIVESAQHYVDFAQRYASVNRNQPSAMGKPY